MPYCSSASNTSAKSNATFTRVLAKLLKSTCHLRAVVGVGLVPADLDAGPLNLKAVVNVQEVGSKLSTLRAESLEGLRSLIRLQVVPERAERDGPQRRGLQIACQVVHRGAVGIDRFQEAPLLLAHVPVLICLG